MIHDWDTDGGYGVRVAAWAQVVGCAAVCLAVGVLAGVWWGVLLGGLLLAIGGVLSEWASHPGQGRVPRRPAQVTHPAGGAREGVR